MIEQLGIVLTGVTAVVLSQSEMPSRRKWACIFGLAGQPFWIYAAASSQMWGMLVITLLYTLSWAKGFRTHWLTKEAN